MINGSLISILPTRSTKRAGRPVPRWIDLPCQTCSFTLVRTEESASTTKTIELLGDAQLRRARASTMAYASELDFGSYIKAFAQRSSMLREWMLFFEHYPVLLMPVSCELPFPVDFDQQGDAAVARMLTAHHPMLAVSLLGLPGLSVPMGLSNGIPIGVQWFQRASVRNAVLCR